MNLTHSAADGRNTRLNAPVPGANGFPGATTRPATPAPLYATTTVLPTYSTNSPKRARTNARRVASAPASTNGSRRFLPIWVFAAVWALLMLCDPTARAHAWELIQPVADIGLRY